MGVTNLGRVQGGGFYYADYTPSEAETSIRLGRVWLKPNTVKALIGDHVVMADGSLWEITAFSDGEADLVMTLERKTSIRGKIGETGAQGEAGIGCSIKGVPTALDFTSDPQIQLDELKQQNTSQSSQIDVLKNLYAVGSIYMSTNSTSPAELFGGTWEQIKDRFLIGAGGIYNVGATGGEATHTLTIDEMPSHRHGFSALDWTDGTNGTSIGKVGSAYPNQAAFNVGADWGENGNLSISFTGGSQPHNNMPPYLAIYIWKRTA